MTGRLKDIIFTRKGEQIISFITRSDFSEEFDRLKDVDVEVEIEKYFPPRSTEANKYCWTLCGKLAEKLSAGRELYTKDDVYRDAIREIGVFRDYDHLTPEQAKTLRYVWEDRGTGWITEQFEDAPGTVTLRCYYGSSKYNSKQMSRLIDNLIQDCRALGIPTDTPEQIARIKSLWADGDDCRPAQKKGN